jgi:gliding-associated putative ABC transporter substrate-binding component GldG
MENMQATPPPSEKRKYVTKSIVTGLLLSIAMLVLLNLISAFVYTRLDFSKGKIHTLSKTSKKLVHNLKDNIVVKVYLSNNLPPEYATIARYTKDLLGEYKQSGGSHFRYEIISTTNEDMFKAEATRNNVFSQRVMILENDQQTVRDIFMGLSFEYKGNHETLNLTSDIEGRLEYEITAILRRLTKESLPKVAVYEDSLYNSQYYQYFEHHLKQNYQIVPTDLTIPDMSAQVLIFPGVVDSLEAIKLYNLDQYIMHGGKVLFLQDRVYGLVQYNQAEEIYSNIFKFLEQYGIEIKPNLVLDNNCAPINMSQRSGIYVVDVPMPFPPIPLVQGMKSSIISKGLSDILFYLCSEINIHPTAKNITVSPILQTSAGSGVMNGPVFDISPENYLKQKFNANLTMPPITVAALYDGTFTSYFAKMPSIAATPGFVGQTNKSEIIVVSDSDIIRDFITSASGSNMMFILNAIDFLLKDISLSEVRSRTIPNSPLDISNFLYKHGMPMEKVASAEPAAKRIIKGINLIIPALLLVLLGIWRFFKLKKDRLAIKRKFQFIKPDVKEPEEQDEV